MDWAKPLNFQDSYEKVSPSKQTAEVTYLTGGTVLEFNVIVPIGQYVRPANWELVLSVRFKTGDGNKIHLGRSLTVNNVFGHYLEIIAVSHKDDFENDCTSTTF